MRLLRPRTLHDADIMPEKRGGDGDSGSEGLRNKQNSFVAFTLVRSVFYIR